MDEFDSIAVLVESMPFMDFADGPVVASKTELDEIEAMIGAALPPDYVWFASTVGLIMTPSEWTMQPESAEELDITVLFGGTDDSRPAYSISQLAHRFGQKVLNAGELFVGRDSFSNLYVLNALTNQYRFVFLDGHRSIDPGATGLEEFLRLIKPQSPDG